MNTWLYRRCGIYRRQFAEELYIRSLYRKINRNQINLQKQMKVAADFFGDEMKAGNFRSALEIAAFYIDAYIKLHN